MGSYPLKNFYGKLLADGNCYGMNLRGITPEVSIYVVYARHSFLD